MTENITKIFIETCVLLCRFAANFRSYSSLLSYVFPIIISPMDFEQTFGFFRVFFVCLFLNPGYHFLFCSIQVVKLNFPSPSGTQCHLYPSFCLFWRAHRYCTSLPSSVTAAHSLVPLQCPAAHPVPEFKFCLPLAESPGKAISVNHSWLSLMSLRPWHTSNSAFLIKCLPHASSAPFCAFYISLLLPYVLLCQLLCLSVSVSLNTFWINAMWKINIFCRISRIFSQDLVGLSTMLSTWQIQGRYD